MTFQQGDSRMNSLQRFGITVASLALAVIPATVASQPLPYVRQWGTFGFSNGDFTGPNGLAVDAADNVYVADLGSGRIQKFDSRGVFLAKWSGFGLAGLAVSREGIVYGTSYNSHRVEKYSNTGEFLGSWGTPGTGPGQFSFPSGVAVAGNGNVYVVDQHRVQVFDADGNFLNQWGSFGENPGQFSYPYGIAVDGAGNVYVVEVVNSRVQKFDANGAFLATWGTRGSHAGEFYDPFWVAADAAGNVYVSDYGNSRVEQFDTNGTFLSAWGSTGSGNGQFNLIQGIGVDGSGNVYVADYHNYRIQKFGFEVDNTPPSLSVALSPVMLWPPNHKLASIHATVTATDDSGDDPALTLVSVTSNEPDNESGDGNVPDDIQDAAVGTADFEFLLRSERAGPGTGRTYSVCYSATDASGNTASACGAVFVSHDQSGQAHLVSSAEATELVIRGAPGAPVRDLVPGSAMWGTADFLQAPLTEAASFADRNGDGIEDAFFTLTASDGGKIRDAQTSGAALFARWQNGSAWFLANLQPLGTTDVPLDGMPTLSASVRPNPAIGTVSLRYALLQRTHVRLSVFDLAGREVARLVDGQESAGEHQLRWGPSRNGAPAVYMYRLQTRGQSVQGRFVIIQ